MKVLVTLYFSCLPSSYMCVQQELEERLRGKEKDVEKLDSEVCEEDFVCAVLNISKNLLSYDCFELVLF